MANVQYGESIYLQCLGYQTSIAAPPIGGYLAFDKAGQAVTTTTPVGAWKFVSPLDKPKTGDVQVGDTVNVVYTGPTVYHVPGLLQCQRESNAIAKNGSSPSTNPDVEWLIFMAQQQPSTSGPIPEGVYFCFSSSLAGKPVPMYGNYAGEFLVINALPVQGAPGPLGDAKVQYMVGSRQGLDAHVGGDVWWKAISVAAANAPPPPPPLTTGQKCCVNVPDHAFFTVAFVNKETSAKTINVTITGQMPVDIPVPAGHSTGSRNLIAGPGNPLNQICIEVDNSKSTPMLLGWRPPVLADGRYSIQIGAENPPDTGFHDIVVTVSWAAS